MAIETGPKPAGPEPIKPVEDKTKETAGRTAELLAIQCLQETMTGKGCRVVPASLEQDRFEGTDVIIDAGPSRFRVDFTTLKREDPRFQEKVRHYLSSMKTFKTGAIPVTIPEVKPESYTSRARRQKLAETVIINLLRSLKRYDPETAMYFLRDVLPQLEVAQAA